MTFEPAISDRILNIEQALQSLADGRFEMPQPRSAAEFSRKFARGAAAASEARQASVLTALRYYYFGGLIEVRADLDRAIRLLPVKPAYVEAVGGRTAGAIYASRQRRRVQGKVPLRAERYLPEIPSSPPVSQADAVLMPDGPPDEPGQVSHVPTIVRAALLLLAGMPVESACDDTGASQIQVERLIHGAAGDLHAAGIRSLSPQLKSADSMWARLAPALANWAFANRSALRRLLDGPARPLKAKASALSVVSLDFTHESRQVWVDLSLTGVQTIFNFGPLKSVSERAIAERQLLDSGVQLLDDILPRQGIGLVRFVSREKGTIGEPSNHSAGKTGSLVIASALFKMEARLCCENNSRVLKLLQASQFYDLRVSCDGERIQPADQEIRSQPARSDG